MTLYDYQGQIVNNDVVIQFLLGSLSFEIGAYEVLSCHINKTHTYIESSMLKKPDKETT